MPGLLRGVARTAVIAGTATSVSNRVSRRQANRWATQEDQQYASQQQYYAQQQAQPQYYAQQQPQAAPPPPPAPDPGSDTVAQLQKLGELKAQGILSDAEFEAAKAKILAP
jgi:hypothetical protein